MSVCENCGKQFEDALSGLDPKGNATGVTVGGSEHSSPCLCPECSALAEQVTTSFTPVSASPVRGSVPAAPLEAAGGHAQTHTPEQDICLCVVKGPQIGECFYLEGDHISIGRDPQSQLFLNDMTVSREHAVIERRAHGGIWLRDGGSLNGSYLNGTVVEEAELKDGDLLQIGTFQLAFRAGSTLAGR